LKSFKNLSGTDSIQWSTVICGERAHLVLLAAEAEVDEREQRGEASGGQVGGAGAERGSVGPLEHPHQAHQ
jgi:hypothetical protein